MRDTQSLTFYARPNQRGYQANADYVGAVNISRRGLHAVSDAPPASGRPERAQGGTLVSSRSVELCVTG